MSTTPVLTALPASNVGIAFGPPMKLICSVPLPSALNFCSHFCMWLHVDAVLGERADQAQRGLLRARRARNEERGGKGEGRKKERGAAVHGRRFWRGCRTDARGGLPTLPGRAVAGRGLCLEPAGGGGSAPGASLSGASSSRRSRRGSGARARARSAGPMASPAGASSPFGSPGGRCRERRRAPAAGRPGRRRPIRLARREPARRRLRACKRFVADESARQRRPLVATHRERLHGFAGGARARGGARLEDLPHHFGTRDGAVSLARRRRWRRPRGSRR